MDITKFVVTGRESALLYGDYATYQGQLAKKLLNCRKKLNVATKNRGKYHKKDQVTAEQIGGNHEYLHLMLLTSERAWAQAMSMKSLHTADNKGITGRTRSHIISRFDKAARTAEALVENLSQPEAGASRNDRLEATAYAALIRGTTQTEKGNWEACLKSLSIARVIYSAMATSTKGDIFKDLISETLDISIRFAAHQLEMPRTIPIPTVARNVFPKSDSWIVQQINDIDNSILSQDTSLKKDGPIAENAARTLTWRSREVKIEDAAIAVAWSQVLEAKIQLSKRLVSITDTDPKELANAYDDILAATQDAVDATKDAIDDMREEGVSQSDPRMQSLQITRTAVNFEMISWRIGRNRVLTGERDGVKENYQTRSRKKAKTHEHSNKKSKVATPSQMATRLKEKVALYEGTLQSLESVKELPGVAADEVLAGQLDATAKYFIALKALSIARSHAIAGNITNALALIKHAYDQSQAAAPALSSAPQPSSDSPRNIQVTAEDAESLQTFLEGELQRHRALVHLENLQKEAAADDGDSQFIPLIDRLDKYPPNGVVDLKNLVNIPPKPSLMPVKPIFLDVAWNYIEYPEKKARLASQAKESASEPKPAATQAPQKKGWFGFGR